MKKKTAFLGICLGFSMILSYLESLIPPLVAIPGIKIGLANIAVLFVLIKYGVKESVLVSFVRVFLSALLFGNIVGLTYSLCGAFLSLLVMSLLKSSKLFSAVGISMAGGVFHNIGQIIAAAFVVGSTAVMYYLPFLLISGIVSGIAVGVTAGIILKKLNNI